jgi:hypothetical protein
MKLVMVIEILDETSSYVRMSKVQFYTFPAQKGLKEGDTSPSWLFNFGVEYSIRKVEEGHDIMELNRTHQLHVYIIGDNFFLLSYCLA